MPAPPRSWASPGKQRVYQNTDGPGDLSSADLHWVIAMMVQESGGFPCLPFEDLVWARQVFASGSRSNYWQIRARDALTALGDLGFNSLLAMLNDHSDRSVEGLPQDIRNLTSMEIADVASWVLVSNHSDVRQWLQTSVTEYHKGLFKDARIWAQKPNGLTPTQYQALLRELSPIWSIVREEILVFDEWFEVELHTRMKAMGVRDYQPMEVINDDGTVSVIRSSSSDTKDNKMSIGVKKSALKSTKDRVQASAVRGLKTVAADSVANTVLEIAEMILGEKFKTYSRTPTQRAVLKLMTATLLIYACEIDGTPVPEAEKVAAACGLVIEAGSRDLIQPHIEKLRPVLLRLAQLNSPMQVLET